MPWTELELICPSCGAKTVIQPETGDRNLVCSRCKQNILSVNIFHPNGFIYVLSNPSMPGLYKIGYTERDVAERAAELSAATGVPEPYIVEAFFSSEAPAVDEAEIHSSLSDFRRTRKEFFRVDLQIALDAIYKICGRSPRYCRPERPYEIPDERAAREARERAQQKVEEEAERTKARGEAEQEAENKRKEQERYRLEAERRQKAEEAQQKKRETQWEPRQRQPEETNGGIPFRLVDRLSVQCPNCGQQYTVTFLRYENRSCCPRCMRFHGIQIEW